MTRTTVVDPSTNQPISEVRRHSPEDVDQAVNRASHAFEAWRNADVRKRRDVLAAIADLVRRDQERLAQIESQNAGKPISAARGEIGAAAAVFDYYAGAVDKVTGQTIPGNAPGTLLTFREPIGVCAAVTPWNFPLLILSWKVAPALAMGNAVLAKPAEVTPLSTLALADLALEAGLPDDVLQVVTGRGSVAGEALVRHPLVRKVSFTGSTTVGTRVMQAAAEDIKRVSLEFWWGARSTTRASTDSSSEHARSVWERLRTSRRRWDH